MFDEDSVCELVNGRERDCTLLRGRIVSHDIFRCFYWKRYSLDDNKCVG